MFLFILLILKTKKQVRLNVFFSTKFRFYSDFKISDIDIYFYINFEQIISIQIYNT